MQDKLYQDEYLFDLDHFIQLREGVSSDVAADKLPTLPRLTEAEDGVNPDTHLVLDARTTGTASP